MISHLLYNWILKKKPIVFQARLSVHLLPHINMFLPSLKSLEAIIDQNKKEPK